MQNIDFLHKKQTGNLKLPHFSLCIMKVSAAFVEKNVSGK